MLKLSTARLSTDALQAIAERFYGRELTGAVVDERRRASQQAPTGLPAALDAALDAEEAERVPAPTHKPLWLSLLCANRDTLGNIVVSFDDPSGRGDRESFLLMYATKNPIFAAFTRVYAEPRNALAPMGSGALGGRHWEESWAHAFVVGLGEHVWAPDLPGLWFPPEEIGVHTGIHHVANFRIVTDDEVTPMSDFLASLPIQKRPKEGPKKEQKKDETEARLKAFAAKHPWAEKYILCPGLRPGALKEKEEESSEDEEAVELDEEEVADIYGVLKEVRDVFGIEETAPDVVHFAFRITGGKWAVRDLKRAVDGFHNEAHSLQAKIFCLTFDLNTVARFATSVHGNHGGSVLSEEWRRVMTAGVNVWLHSEKTFGLLEVQRRVREIHVEGDFFAGLSHGANLETVERMRKIRAIFGTGPPTSASSASASRSSSSGASGAARASGAC